MLRELFNNYICATERAEQKQYYSGEAETETRLQLQMSTMDPDKDEDSRFIANSFYCANTARGIIGVISVWFIPGFRTENKYSKIVALIASDEAILLTNACLTNLVSTVNVDIITIEVSVQRNLQKMKVHISLIRKQRQ